MPESSVASTYLSLNVHIIFSTKHRAPSIDAAWRDDLHAYIGGTIRGLGGVPLAVGGTADHIHLLAGMKATQAVADLVRETKKASTAWARERWAAFSWQEGYAALSVGRSEIPHVVSYIQSQEEHHRKWTSQDELRAILEEHGIEIDERFFE